MKTLMISTVSALFVTGVMASTAQAQQAVILEPYVGGDALFWELDDDQGGKRDSVGLRLNGGVQFNDYFAVEGHLGAGGSDGSADLDSLAGAYAKGILPVSREFRLYGLLGATEVDVSRGGSESDVSYGGGAEFDLTPNLALGADYMRYLDKSDYTFDATSVGLKFRF
ncbi:porin family protein [Halomonas korlensis]|uniref:Outer membrane autotransporter barrel domain-containing protein n=1 Tax=Halomonas korlensis TaxID=463301 RepID=A0A1I7G021_9GAMM|nr:porin family protein [Halomonas korlensis]SFU41799.1 outer membrane autotransporter barrel domain-containing protein [Halomonas korlensis]